jgi:hypothetical protein
LCQINVLKLVQSHCSMNIIHTVLEYTSSTRGEARWLRLLQIHTAAPCTTANTLFKEASGHNCRKTYIGRTNKLVRKYMEYADKLIDRG